MARKHSAKMLVVLVVALVGFIGKRAWAVTYYVDQNNSQASDMNSGAESRPFETLTRACGIVMAGDTVFVKAGLYVDPNATWDNVFTPANSGTAGKPIVFKSHPKHAATLERARPRSRDYLVFDGFKGVSQIGFHGCNHCVVRNCDVINGYHEGSNLNWGAFLHSCKSCTLENNYVHDMVPFEFQNNEACIMVFRSTDCLIQNNVADAGGNIYSAFGQKAGGIYRCVWRYNVALNGGQNGFLGMAATANDQPSDDNYYHQNTAINCKSAFALDHLCTNWKVYNNVAYGCSKFYGGWRYNGSQNLWNNIVVNSSEVYSTGQNTITEFFSYSDYNCYTGQSKFCTYNNNTYAATLQEWKTKTSFDGHSISSNPLFVNASTRDFHVQAGSPCLNAGIDRQDHDGDGNTAERINMGLYITGKEIIGLVPDSSSSIAWKPGNNVRSVQAGNGMRNKSLAIGVFDIFGRTVMGGRAAHGVGFTQQASEGFVNRFLIK